MQTANLRPHPTRRDDAWIERTGDLAANQGYSACHSRSDVHQKRGGEHHGPSHRVQDSRLSDQARQPQPDITVAQKEYPPQGHRDRGDAERIPAGLSADSHADDGLPQLPGLDGSV